MVMRLTSAQPLRASGRQLDLVVSEVKRRTPMGRLVYNSLSLQSVHSKKYMVSYEMYLHCIIIVSVLLLL